MGDIALLFLTANITEKKHQKILRLDSSPLGGVPAGNRFTEDRESEGTQGNLRGGVDFKKLFRRIPAKKMVTPSGKLTWITLT